MKKIVKLTIMAMIVLLAAPTSAVAKQSKSMCKHVVLIGLDGWGSYSVEKAKMPVVKELMARGSYTLQKRAVLPSSSAVNWATMFMGASPELHGYTTWGSQTPEIPSREVNQNGIFPTIFSLLRQSEPKAEIACLYEWIGMKYVVDTLALSHHQNVPYKAATPQTMRDVAVQYITQNKPRLVSIFFDNPDHVGHEIGHNTPQYYKTLEQQDAYVADIIQATKTAGIYDQTIFIVTSDHGGINKGHGGKTLSEIETPFIICGPNIKQGHLIQSSVMQFDVASTMAQIFNVKQPQVWIGRSMTECFVTLPKK